MVNNRNLTLDVECTRGSRPGCSSDGRTSSAAEACTDVTVVVVVLVAEVVVVVVWSSARRADQALQKLQDKSSKHHHLLRWLQPVDVGGSKGGGEPCGFWASWSAILS